MLATVMLNHLAPRAYTDLAVPPKDGGIDYDKDFEAYVIWLTDYLFNADVPLHPRQKEYAAEMETVDPGTAIFKIADNYGLALLPLENLEGLFIMGAPWEFFDEEQRRIWDEEYPAEHKEMETYEEYATRQDVWQRIHDEFWERKRLKDVPNFLDLPYRALLSRALKRIPEREKKLEELKSYFRIVSDWMMK